MPKTVTLPSGAKVAALGLGTWRYGEDPANRQSEIATLQAALDCGVTLIDTAEMYGEGEAEKVIGTALKGRREQAWLVSKVYPHNASRKGVVAACERSLKRMQTDVIDLYLLHWRGSVPFEATIAGFQDLIQSGKIRSFGVSNLDLQDMDEFLETPGGDQVQTNQLLYNLTRRGIEWDLLPWLRERAIPIMAYSPIEQARLLKNRKLMEFSKRHGMTPSQAALAWLLSADDVIVIPKTSDPARLAENVAALQHPLNAEQLRELDQLFPPPQSAQPLDVL